MTWLLAIETSTRYGGLALFNHEKLLQTSMFSPEKPASEYLVPNIQEMLVKECITEQDLSSVAVSIGPGSFTGLRVGLTAAKTMAWQLKIPVYTVSSLMALAASSDVVSQPVAAIMDARRKEVYGAYFYVQSALKRVTEDMVMKLDDFLGLAPVSGIHVIGDAILVYKNNLDRHHLQITFADKSLCYPSPVYVGKLVFQNMARTSSGKDIFGISPVYLRQSEAEINWDRKHSCKK